jgi:hypothetical protein
MEGFRRKDGEILLCLCLCVIFFFLFFFQLPSHFRRSRSVGRRGERRGHLQGAVDSSARGAHLHVSVVYFLFVGCFTSSPRQLHWRSAHFGEPVLATADLWQSEH